MRAHQILAMLILFVTSVASLASASEDAVHEAALPLNWEHLSSDAEKNTYVLKSSLKYSSKGIVELWTLWDYKVQQTGQADRKFMSMKQLNKFSCKSRTTQMLSVAMYAGAMGSGTLIAMANLKDQPWVKIAPLSAREVIFNYLCTDGPKFSQERAPLK